MHATTGTGAAYTVVADVASAAFRGAQGCESLE